MIKPLKFEGDDNWKTAYTLGYVYKAYQDRSGCAWMVHIPDRNGNYCKYVENMDSAIAACNEHWRNIVFSLLDKEKVTVIKRFPWTCGTCGKDLESGTITKDNIFVKCNNCGSEWVS